MQDSLQIVGFLKNIFGFVKGFRLHDFFADPFVFLENLIISFLHDFAVESGKKRGFSVGLILPGLNGFDFGEEKMIVFFHIMELFY